MKFIAIIGLAIIASASAVEQEIYKLPPLILNKIKDHAIPCAKEYNIDLKFIPKLADGTLPRDDASNKFLHCFTKSAGYISEDGHMVVDNLSNLIKDHPRVAEFREALKKCNEVTKENPMATLIAMNTCFAEDTPLRFVF